MQQLPLFFVFLKVTSHKTGEEASRLVLRTLRFTCCQSLDECLMRRRKAAHDLGDQASAARNIVVRAIWIDDGQTTVFVVEDVAHIVSLE